MADLKEILEIDLKGNPMIYIIGKAGAGKTHLSNLMKYMGRVIHTDDYLDTEDQIGNLWDAIILNCWGKAVIIVEGMLCYQLLKMSAESPVFYPSIVIDVQITRAKQEQVYRETRNPEKIKYLKKFDMKCTALLNEYYRLMEGKTMPQIINFNNEY